MTQKTLSVKLSLNDKQFQSALKKSTRSIQRFGNKMQGFGETLTRNITLPVLGLGAAAVKLASDFEETQSKFNTVFRDISESAQAASKDLSDNFGLSSRASMQLLSDTGDLLTGFGFTQKEALKLSTEVNKLAVDLASFTNFSGGAEGASLALTKALLGERESIKSLGIAITEADLKSFAADQGLVFKEMNRVEKATLTFNLAMQQSQNAIGDFARTSDSLANQTRQLKSDFEDLAKDLGKEFLPLAKDLVAGLRDLIRFTSKFSDEQKKGALKVTGFAAVLGPLVIVAGKIVKAFGTLRKFFLGSLFPAFKFLFNIFTKMTPQGRIISGVILAATLIVKNFDKITKAFDTAKKSAEKLLQQIGLLEKVEPLPLDFSVQTTATQAIEGMSHEDIMKRTMAFVNAKKKDSKVTKEQTKDQKEHNETVEDYTKKIKEATSFMQKFNKELEREDLFKEIENNLDNFFKKVDIPDIEDLDLDEAFIDEEMMMELEELPELINSEGAVQKFEEMQESMKETAGVFSSSFSSMSADAETSFRDIGNAALNSARQVIKAAVGQAIASQIAKVLATVPFPFNLAIASAAGVAVGGLFDKAIPAFANGGLVTGATIGLIGEGPGTSMSNPEVIAPLDKLQSMIGQGQGSVEVFGRISGSDILISSDRARKNRDRTRGY